VKQGCFGWCSEHVGKKRHHVRDFGQRLLTLACDSILEHLGCDEGVRVGDVTSDVEAHDCVIDAVGRVGVGAVPASTQSPTQFAPSHT
jgi:hypothetical protein